MPCSSLCGRPKQYWMQGWKEQTFARNTRFKLKKKVNGGRIGEQLGGVVVGGWIVRNMLKLA